MRKMIYATKGWKGLQKYCISENQHKMHLQKLHAYLQQDVSGYSFEEATIHYGFISHAALQTCVTDYIQSGTLENAEYYFYLASRAAATRDKLWIANPHKQPQQGQEIQLDIIMAAALSGCINAAIDILEKTRLTLELDPVQPVKSRRDAQKNESRRKRISLEIDFYENILQNNDTQARQLMLELENLHHNDLLMQVIRTFLDQNDEQFTEALVLHMKEFRGLPYPEALNCFVILMEALYLKRTHFEPLDLADAPASLLRLPEYDPMQLEEETGIVLPTFDVNRLLDVIDQKTIGPKFKQY